VDAQDLDGDDILDLVTTSPYSESATVHLGTGSGQFVDRLDYGLRGSVAAADLADLNQDGLLDLAVVYRSSSRAGILWNQGDPRAPMPARAFLRSGHEAISTAIDAGETVFRLEPIGDAYPSSVVDRTSISLESSGTGSVTRIFARWDEPFLLEDVDGNGVMELPVRFLAQDLSRLFDRVQGRQTVNATLRGRLTSGGVVVATVRFTVIPATAGLQAWVSPASRGTLPELFISTTRFGRLKVRLYDVAGRLVRELIDEAFTPAGLHVAPIGDRGGGGVVFASGIYFYRIDAAEGVRTGRLSILR
jgi:FG-GAP-like repeat